MGDALGERLAAKLDALAPYAEVESRLRSIEQSLVEMKTRDESSKELKKIEREVIGELKSQLKGVAKTADFKELIAKQEAFKKETTEKLEALDKRIAESEKAAAVDGVDLERVKDLERKGTFSLIGMIFALLGKIIYDAFQH